MSWVDKLVIEYEQGKEALQDIKDNLGDSELDQLDTTQINGMIRDMAYSLNWLKIGREPGTLRGIDRRSVYQRRVIMDMDLFPSLEVVPDDKELTNDEKQSVVDVLAILSARERQCFILHHAYQMSMSDIANELKISKSSVQRYIDRAKDKVDKKTLSYDCHTVAN